MTGQAPAALTNAEAGESAADFAARIERAIQARLDLLTSDRIPVLG